MHASGGVISIPLPLLVLPWVLAIGVWLAFPWIVRRTGRRDALRWVPPGLVLVGGALLWLTAGGEADGRDARATSFAAAAAALCDARTALPDERDTAVRIFWDRAHEPLHALAADTSLDRGLAATLLVTKEDVEARIADDASGDELAAPMAELRDSAVAAMAGIGMEASACDA